MKRTEKNKDINLVYNKRIPLIEEYSIEKSYRKKL